MRTILTSITGRAALPVLTVTALVACASDDSSAIDGGTAEPSGNDSAAKIVVTTSILGDITEEVVGGNAEVQTVMPIGADPHEFSASARQAEAMSQADLLVVNGAGFEAGLDGIIDQAENSGVAVFSFADHVDLLPFDDDHGHEDEAEGDDDDHGEWDPHLWTDPGRVADGVEALRDTVVTLDSVDSEDVQQGTAAYLDELTALDAEIESLLADVPEERRVLVTNHEVFAYFADRYGFDVIGTVVPSITTLAEPAPAELDALAHEVEEHEVPAIFAETTQSTRLADALAMSVGDVEVVELHTESLGEEGSGADTYVGLMRTNAALIANALE